MQCGKLDLHTLMQAHAYICLHAHTHTHTHVRTHAHTHTHTHTHTQTHRQGICTYTFGFLINYIKT